MCTTITLSYTFFRSLDDAARTGALAKAGPHVGPLARSAPTASRTRDDAAAT